MKWIRGLLVASMVLLQQDVLGVESSALIAGFLPQTLLYQASISLATAFVWLLAVRFCWPEDSCSKDDNR